MNYLARVNPRYFAGIHRCAGENDVRYYLNAVNIERHPQAGVALVATTGHVMASIHDPNGWLHPDYDKLTVERTTKRVLSAITKRKGHQLGLEPQHLWIAENCLVLSSEEKADEEPEPFGPFSLIAERSALVLDHKPLDWRRAIPSDADTTPAPWLNSEYLALFNEVGQILSATKHFPGCGMQLVASGENSSVIVRFAHPELMDRFMGLIMPMRNEALAHRLPAFLRTPEGTPA
ncbi:MAG TPA: hypothetical protein DCR72_14485 [Pseudomonas sp.]|nr:hypothetical protein [Pseudomonas sp.]